MALKILTVKGKTSDSFYTIEKISENQELTPEGFLLCKGVPVARTGEQKYLKDEIGLDSDSSGIVTVNRTEDQVFRAETLASFEGKPITITHPYDIDGVTPKNYSVLTRGTMLNVRRGTDSESDLLLADLLVMDQEAINAIQSKRYKEVSCGYDCDYVQDSPGIAHQENIVGNHVALVERGRAGKRCSIKDHDGSKPMSAKALIAKFLRRLKTMDQNTLDETIEELTEDDDDMDEKKEAKKSNDSVTKALDALTKSVDAMNARLDKVEGKDAEAAEENPTDDEDMDAEEMTADTIIEAEKAGKFDNGKNPLTGDSVKDTLSRAEMLVPGFKVQTTDSATSYGKLIKLRQKVLDAALRTEHGRACVSPFIPCGKALDTLTARDTNTAFIAASELARHRNNSGSSKGLTQDTGTKAPTSIAEVNAANAAFWSKQK